MDLPGPTPPGIGFASLGDVARSTPIRPAPEVSPWEAGSTTAEVAHDDAKPVLRLLDRPRAQLPNPNVVIEMMEFLLEGKDPDDVAHRAAAAIGLLPSVERTTLQDNELPDDREHAVELGPSTNADESGTRFLKVELTEHNDQDSTNFVYKLMNLARTVYGRTLKNQRLADEAYTDALTCIWNRRGFLPLVDQALARVSRDGTDIALLICDIDRFKQINDLQGHDAGDEALCHVTRCLQQVLRPSDVVARIGGDELAILLAGADSAGGLRVADRIRQHLQQTPSPVGALTLSVGVADASMTQSGKTRAKRAEIFKLADEALYAAKRAGRDRAVVATRTAAVA